MTQLEAIIKLSYELIRAGHQCPFALELEDRDFENLSICLHKEYGGQYKSIALISDDGRRVDSFNLIGPLGYITIKRRK